jgi:hypothetical protein
VPIANAYTSESLYRAGSLREIRLSFAGDAAGEDFMAIASGAASDCSSLSTTLPHAVIPSAVIDVASFESTLRSFWLVCSSRLFVPCCSIERMLSRDGCD